MNWIETVFGVSLDGGNGLLEGSIIFGLLVVVFTTAGRRVASGIEHRYSRLSHHQARKRPGTAELPEPAAYIADRRSRTSVRRQLLGLATQLID